MECASVQQDPILLLSLTMTSTVDVSTSQMYVWACVFGGINFGNLVKNSPIRQIKIPAKVSGYTVGSRLVPMFTYSLMPLLLVKFTCKLELLSMWSNCWKELLLKDMCFFRTESGLMSQTIATSPTWTSGKGQDEKPVFTDTWLGEGDELTNEVVCVCVCVCDSTFLLPQPSAHN